MLNGVQCLNALSLLRISTELLQVVPVSPPSNGGTLRGVCPGDLSARGRLSYLHAKQDDMKARHAVCIQRAATTFTDVKKPSEKQDLKNVLKKRKKLDDNFFKTFVNVVCVLVVQISIINKF